MDPGLEGFLKEAGVKSWLLKGLARAGSTASSIGSKARAVGGSMVKQVGEAGVKARPARAPGSMGWARGELGSTAKKTVTRQLQDKGRTSVRNRMLVRGGVGAAVGVGHEALSSRGEGKSFSFTDAAVKGLVGGTIGAAAGTTMGKRMLRRTWQAKKTPSLGIGQTVKQPGKTFLQTQKANFKNLSPLEKGYAAMTAADVGTAAVDSNPDGDRGARIGGALGEAGGLLVGSRWRGARRLGSSGRKGSLGAMARTGGLFVGTSVAGSAIGGLADSKKAPAKTVAPGSNRLYDAAARRS